MGSVPITRYKGKQAQYRIFYHAFLITQTSRRHEDELGDVPLSQYTLCTMRQDGQCIGVATPWQRSRRSALPMCGLQT
jgi:hypothetical protein